MRLELSPGWARGIAKVVLSLASLGAIAALYISLASWTGRYQKMEEHPVVWLLFVGIFVVWFPTVILMQRLTRGAMKRDSWKLALRSAPEQIRKLVYASFIYCGVIWASSMLTGAWKKRDAKINEGRYFSAFMLVFYSASIGVSSSVLGMKPEQFDPRCPNGHQVSAEAQFCQVCGAKVPASDRFGA